MRDIVERLRQYADDIRANGERSEIDEAADEIERLRADPAHEHILH